MLSKIFTESAPRLIQSNSRNVRVLVFCHKFDFINMFFKDSKSQRTYKFLDFFKSYSGFNDKKCVFLNTYFQRIGP